MINYKDRQTGGTFLGIIIGLVIGLVIALVVALVITKTPVPFVSRPAKERTEPTPAQMADPNKPLYGNREPAKEAAKEFARVLPGEPSIAPVPPVESKPEVKPPIVDKSVADKPRDVAIKPDSLEDKWTFYLQVGAFREQADAENTRAKLALQGFETQISERPSETGVLYRVRVGPFGQIEAMNKVRSKLSNNGIDVAVVRIPK